MLEGMACGIPAICTDVGGMPEVVEHGVSGYLVADQAGAVEALLEAGWPMVHAVASASVPRVAIIVAVNEA